MVNDKECAAGYSNDCIKFDLDEYESENYEKWVQERKFPLHEGKEYNSEIYIQGNKIFLRALTNIYPK